MHVADYLTEVQRADRNQALMARIILNTLVDAQRYPVDVSELRFLSPRNRGLTNAFEEWAFSHRTWEFSDISLYVLQELANSPGQFSDLVA